MTRKRKFNDRINGEIQLFFKEEAILEDAIGILHKYNSIGNRQHIMSIKYLNRGQTTAGTGSSPVSNADEHILA